MSTPIVRGKCHADGNGRAAVPAFAFSHSRYLIPECCHHDTFSATPWQGWAVGISASGGKGAFPARWPAVMLNGRYLLEVDESPGRCSTRPPTWNRRRKARFTGVIILQPNWRYPLPESQNLAGQQSPAGENHLGYARGSTWELLQQALQGEGRRRWRSERRPLPGAAGRWPRPASRLWRLGCR